METGYDSSQYGNILDTDGSSPQGLTVRVLNTKLIDEYMVNHSRCRGSLRAWLADAEVAAWATPTEVKARYPKASILSENRVVFDITGNRYRLLCRIAYKSAIVIVQRIGTHAEYSKWIL